LTGLSPERHLFKATTTAKRVFDAEKMVGTKLIIMQNDSSNTDDILIDTDEAFGAPMRLTPCSSLILDAPPGHAGPPFGIAGLPTHEEYWFEFDIVVQSASGTQVLTVWLFKPHTKSKAKVKSKVGTHVLLP
jgi:hypothetical protein